MEEEINKILIIDDDEDVLLAAKMLLKRHIKEVMALQMCSWNSKYLPHTQKRVEKKAPKKDLFWDGHD